MKAHWAKADDAKGKKLRSSKPSEKVRIRRFPPSVSAELAKALYEVADAKRRILRTPEQKATIDLELTRRANRGTKPRKTATRRLGRMITLRCNRRSPSSPDEI